MLQPDLPSPVLSGAQDEAVVIRRQGRTGRLLLNRPRALNALDWDMIGTLSAALDGWRDDPEIHAVVVEGAGGRAFCAGGDIRAVRNFILAERWDEIDRYFAAEYALDQAIADYPKPYVALVDGICMGGGVGISVHGTHRVASEAAVFAMPETAIGLFPDIGASFILPRLRGSFGMYMGLTGARAEGADAVWVGLATHLVPRSRIGTLADRVAADGVAVLADEAQPVEGGAFPAIEDAVNRCFSAEGVPEIMARLEAEGTDWARATLATLRSMSPSSLAWTYGLVRAGQHRTLPQALAAEHAMTRKVVRHPDLAEGIRAMVVDKDRAPRWSPARIEDVDPDAVARMLA